MVYLVPRAPRLNHFANSFISHIVFHFVRQAAAVRRGMVTPPTVVSGVSGAQVNAAFVGRFVRCPAGKDNTGTDANEAVSLFIIRSG